MYFTFLCITVLGSKQPHDILFTWYDSSYIYQFTDGDIINKTIKIDIALIK